MVDYSYSEDGMPIPKQKGAFSQPFASENDVTNIFDIRGDGFDVTLSLANGTISWVNVSGNGSAKSKGLFKKKKGVNEEVLPLKDIIGVTMKRRRGKSKNEGEGMCLGFTIYTYQVFGPNNLRDRVIELEHPSEKICKEFCTKIMNYIEATTTRPKSMKLYLQSYAGGHKSKDIYEQKIKPLFNAANMKIDETEVQHNEHIKQEMIHLNLDQFDCITCVGGDGTVSKLATALLNKMHAVKHIDLKLGFTPTTATIPLGIIPTGTTNQTAKSVLGLLDPVSAAINIILGRTAVVDVVSIFNKDKFLQWGFICQYGFAGNVLKMAKKYNSVGLGSKGLEAAVVKALSKSKFRTYECDIEYLPADPLPKEQEYVRCRTGCTVCISAKTPEEDDVSDEVEECLVQPFNSSNNSNDFNGLNDNDDENLAEEVLEDNPWRACKGSFHHVGLYSIPGNCEVAPEGLSKFTHLADGAMELVLVKDCTRKDFIRYLKRHGNHKNQFDFPFVEIHRVKEVKFKPRFPIGWNYSDSKYNEVEDRMRSTKHRMSIQKSQDSHFLDGDSGSLHTPSPQRADSVEDLDDIDDSDEDDDFDDSRPNSSVKNNNVYKRKDNVLVNTAPQEQRLCGPQYRPTFAEEEKWRRKSKVLKKEEKKKIKEESRMKSVWNIDNEMCEDTLLNFRVHHGLLSISGIGLSPDTVFVASPLSCLPLI